LSFDLILGFLEKGLVQGLVQGLEQVLAPLV
jgi:hypothetical protein